MTFHRPWWRFIGGSPDPYAAFGDGLDGDVIIDSSVSLSRDMYYNNLTILTGGELDPNGYRVFVKAKLTMSSGALIQRNGIDGEALTGKPGDGLDSGTVGGSCDGGNGAWYIFSIADGSDGSGGYYLGGGSGVGGNGSVGVGGLSSLQVIDDLPGNGGVRYFGAWPVFMKGATLKSSTQYLGGGGGGGGGGGDGITPPYIGGGGGSGGGVIILVANQIIAAAGSAIESKGGAGGTPESATTGGGGAGGGGGCIAVITTSSTSTINWTADVSGGSGAVGLFNGTNGSAGSYYLFSGDAP